MADNVDNTADDDAAGPEVLAAGEGLHAIAVPVHHRHDTGWPELPEGEHAVTELSSARSGALSPFGDEFTLPIPADHLPYLHPITVPNR